MSQSTYTRAALASTLDVGEELVKSWIRRGLLSPAHGCHHVLGPARCNPRLKYYTDDHVRQGRALIAIKDLNTCLHDLGDYLRDEGISAVEYLARRRQMLSSNGLGETSRA